MSTITREQRHTRRNPCQVCGGYDELPRDKQVRCWGFRSEDGEWEHCTRAEFAGGLAITQAGTYAHRLQGDCGCGRRHDAARWVTGNGKQPNDRSANGRQQIETYQYRDATGKLLFQVLRYEPKDFNLRRPDGNGGWIWNLDSVPRPLYRLPELAQADPGRPVYVLEGEKDVETLCQLGFVATTCPGGAGKWHKLDSSMSEHFLGRVVVIVPDFDEPGREHAEEVAEALHGVAGSVRVLELPGLPDKGDVSDWVENHRQALRVEQLDEQRIELEIQEKLDTLTQQAPEWMPPGGEAGARVESKPGTDGKGAAAGERTGTEPAAAAVVVLHQFHRTDSGNAQCFSLLHGEITRFDWKRRRWLLWTEGEHRWEEADPGQVMTLAKETVKKRLELAVRIEEKAVHEAEVRWALGSENNPRLEAMIALARSENPIYDKGDNWDSDPWLLGVPNGVVDLRSGELRTGRPEDRITMSTGVPFDPHAECPRWKQFLVEVFGDPVLIDFVQRALGYSMSGDCSEEVLFDCYGVGSNGKSTLLETVRAVLGDYAYNTPFSTFEMQARASIPSDVAALVGRRFVTASETSERARLNESRIKALTGRDTVTARKLYRDEFQYVPNFKIWLAANFKPLVSDDSPGFWRRIRVIPFVNTFTGDAVDRRLKDTLRAEAPGILQWLVRGCLLWQGDGLGTAPMVKEATETYREEMDSLAGFLTECCVVRPEAWASSRALWEAYQGYSKGDRWTIPTQRAFGTKLKGHGFEPDNRGHGNVRGWRGVGLRAEGDTPAPDQRSRPAPGRQGDLGLREAAGEC